MTDSTTVAAVRTELDMMLSRLNEVDSPRYTNWATSRDLVLSKVQMLERWLDDSMGYHDSKTYAYLMDRFKKETNHDTDRKG